MKKLLLIFLLLDLHAAGQTVTQKVKTKTTQRVDSKADQGLDKGLDKTEQAISDLFKKKPKKEKKQTAETQSNANGTAVNAQQSSNANSSSQVNSFSDFVPGTKVIFFDDFKQDALADFPANWNSNGSGKVVTIEGVSGRWLDIVYGSTVNPVLNKPIPENCTIEFDMFLQVQQGKITPFINFGLTPVKDIMREDLAYKEKFFIGINRYDENEGRTLEYGLKEVIGHKNDFPLPAYLNKVLRVSMAINKTRVRVYFDKTKLIDLPRALTPDMRNTFYFSNMHMVPASEIGVLISNIRIASAETDARSLLIKQLMEEGRAVTNDILFDVNSDVIKKESFDIVNQFGDALKADPTLKIRITGHTDSDGTSVKNMELSEKRAASVKRYLMSNYNIDNARIQADGKGASEPVSENSSMAGKAKNRRVEFTKL